MPRTPINSLEAFIHQHDGQRRQLARYVTTGRGRHDPPAWAIEAIKHGDPRSLKATSYRARIAFARAAEGLFREPFCENPGPVAFLTLTDVRDARPLSQAAHFDVEDLKARVVRWLEPYPFLAVIEIAYYSNRYLPGAREPTICWHAHALVWDLPKPEMRRRLAAVNASTRAFIETKKAAHGRYLNRDVAAENLFYMLKIPVSDYRAYPMRGERVDWETGEITTSETGRFAQRKRALRPGDAVRALGVLCEFELDDLTFASDWAETLRRLALGAARTERGRQTRMLREDIAESNGKKISRAAGRTWLNMRF